MSVSFDLTWYLLFRAPFRTKLRDRSPDSFPFHFDVYFLLFFEVLCLPISSVVCHRIYFVCLFSCLSFSRVVVVLRFSKQLFLGHACLRNGIFFSSVEEEEEDDDDERGRSTMGSSEHPQQQRRKTYAHIYIIISCVFIYIIKFSYYDEYDPYFVVGKKEENHTNNGLSNTANPAATPPSSELLTLVLKR